MNTRWCDGVFYLITIYGRRRYRRGRRKNYGCFTKHHVPCGVTKWSSGPAHISGKLRKHFIKITVGDIVKMEMSPQDLEKARIVYRLKNAEVNRNAPIRSYGPGPTQIKTYEYNRINRKDSTH